MTNTDEAISNFLKNSIWIFAKTYASTWPHEYIVREKVDEKLFDAFAKIIDLTGYTEKFYKKNVIYLDIGKYTYWHMDNIINRCVIEDTYHKRLVDGRLPNS